MGGNCQCEKCHCQQHIHFPSPRTPEGAVDDIGEDATLENAALGSHNLEEDMPNLSRTVSREVERAARQGPKHTMTKCRTFDSKKKVISFGTSSSQNQRDHMEDIHKAVIANGSGSSSPSNCDHGSSDLGSFSFFGVFDGHGGRNAAEFVEEHLYASLASQPKDWLKKDAQEVLRTAFFHTEEKLLQTAKEKDWMDGTTAVVALVDGNATQCIVGNVGDSMAVVGFCSSDGKTSYEVLTEKHNVRENSSERDRIIDAGGKEWKGRLAHPCIRPQFMSLSVSRSLGDIFYKDPEFTQERLSGLIGEPFISVTDLGKWHSHEHLLILASDGLWDSMSPEEVVSFAFERLHQQEEPQKISSSMIEKACELGAKDNITVVIALL